MASWGHSALEVHLTVVVLWLTRKRAVVPFSTATFGSSVAGSKEGPMLRQKFTVITQKPQKGFQLSYRLWFGGFPDSFDLFRRRVKPFRADFVAQILG